MNFQTVRGGLDWEKSLPLIKHIRVLDGARIGSWEMATSYCTKIDLDFLLGLHAKPEPRPVRRSVRCAPVVRVVDRGRGGLPGFTWLWLKICCGTYQSNFTKERPLRGGLRKKQFYCGLRPEPNAPGACLGLKFMTESPNSEER